MVLEVIVEDFNSTAVRLKVTPKSYVNEDIHIGYAYYLKQAPIKNVTMFDGRHGCGFDKWVFHILISRRVYSRIFQMANGNVD